MPRVFVSYRREDASGHAGRIYDRLALEFGGEQVFMDVDAVRPGVDFVRELEQAVGSCDVLIVVIGPQWVSASKGGRRRLENPRDWVRIEVAEGLKREDVTVVPVLVNGADPPQPADLPRSLSKLARVQAFEINDRRFSRDAGELTALVKEAVGSEGGAEAPAASPASDDDVRVSIQGRARVGASLTCQAEGWRDPAGTQRQWLRRPPGESAAWTEIPGATSWMYTAAPSDLGHHLAVRVTGEEGGSVRSATSAPIGPIGEPVQATASRFISAAARRISTESRRIVGEPRHRPRADQPWACDLCDARFASLEEAEAHPAAVHPDVPRVRALRALRRR